jgi:hypothetical protein
MSNVFREGMEMPMEPDDASVGMKMPPKRKKERTPAKPKSKPQSARTLTEEEMEVPESVKRRFRQEDEDREMMRRAGEAYDKATGMKCGGKVKKYSGGGKVRGDGIARKGKTKGRMC